MCFKWVVVGGGTALSNWIVDGGLLVKPFPDALKNDMCWGAGLTVGAAASAMLIMDSGNREGGYGSVGERSCFARVIGSVKNLFFMFTAQIFLHLPQNTKRYSLWQK